MLKGFKDFIMRGNLVELAVAFIIGAAFALVVTTFTAVLMGFIGKIGGQPDFSAVTIADVKVGDFINAVISFLIVAAVVYFFVVTPYNRLQARMARGEEATPPSPDIALLTEIRDLLAGRPGTGNVQGGGGLT
jgi:large conductance mechanosensitive channel